MVRDGDEKNEGRRNKKNSDPDKEALQKNGSEQQVSTVTNKRYGRRLGDVSAGESRTIVWMITFTDVMGLMLTFFVMMFAMSKPAPQQWEEITSALHNEFNKLYGATFNRGPTDEINIGKINYDRALDINYLTTLLEAITKDSEYLQQARLIKQPGRLIISMPQELLFHPGDAVITDEGARALYALGGTLSRIKNKIQIAGHADPRPVHSGEIAEFGSNWDLSLARAASVAGLLNSVGYDQDIDIVGMASGRYDDLGAIKDEVKRLDLARRVDIVLLDNDGRKKELLFDLISP